MQLHGYIRDRTLIGYLWQFLNRCVEWGGLYQDVQQGIPRGASLSPRLGAFYLLELDRRLESLEVKYFRYMDDILILAATRWKLRKAIRELNRTFDGLKLAKHPDKTAMGRMERGFDFLGYHFQPPGISLATQTLAKCASKALRLYEQEPPHFRVRRLGEYLRRWHLWALSGGIAGAMAAAGGGTGSWQLNRPRWGRCLTHVAGSPATSAARRGPPGGGQGGLGMWRTVALVGGGPRLVTHSRAICRALDWVALLVRPTRITLVQRYGVYAARSRFNIIGRDAHRHVLERRNTSWSAVVARATAFLIRRVYELVHHQLDSDSQQRPSRPACRQPYRSWYRGGHAPHRRPGCLDCDPSVALLGGRAVLPHLATAVLDILAHPIHRMRCHLPAHQLKRQRHRMRDRGRPRHTSPRRPSQ